MTEYKAVTISTGSEALKDKYSTLLVQQLSIFAQNYK